MSFAIGQKIVCIKPRDEWRGPGGIHNIINLPRRGGIYHVRGFDPFIPAGWPDFIFLVEITNPVFEGIVAEPAFIASAFRPVIERKTDISSFTEMLAPSTVDA